MIINVQVRTTAAKEADTTQLMETSVANGTFTKVPPWSHVGWISNELASCDPIFDTEQLSHHSIKFTKRRSASTRHCTYGEHGCDV